MIPVSCGGFNWTDNTFRITRHEHKILHEFLDIPYKLLRRFRLRTNHLVLNADKTYVDELVALHKAYFARIDLLPLKLKKLHVEQMEILTQRFSDEFKVIAIYTATGSLAEQFFAHLDAYHVMHYMVIK